MKNPLIWLSLGAAGVAAWWLSRESEGTAGLGDPRYFSLPGPGPFNLTVVSATRVSGPGPMVVYEDHDDYFRIGIVGEAKSMNSSSVMRSAYKMYGENNNIAAAYVINGDNKVVWYNGRKWEGDISRGADQYSLVKLVQKALGRRLPSSRAAYVTK
jgi:hypothetical protein